MFPTEPTQPAHTSRRARLLGSGPANLPPILISTESREHTDSTFFSETFEGRQFVRGGGGDSGAVSAAFASGSNEDPDLSVAAAG
jgi:hypothetical protein